jgi:hypothetical protein
VEIDTTPIYPRPAEERILTAIGHICRISEYIAPTMVATAELVVRALLARGCTVAAAQWAIADAIRDGLLLASDRKTTGYLIDSDRPPAGLEVSKGVLHINTTENHSWSSMRLEFVHAKLSERLEEDDRLNSSGMPWPDNPDVRDLCKDLAEKSHRMSHIEVAREFTGEQPGDDKKARSLLRQARRFRHLWEADS